MAHSQAKSKPRHPSKPQKAPENPESTARVDRARLMSMLAELPRLSDVQRGAFGAQFSNERCRELGAKTRGAVVEFEAMRFARLAHGFLLGPHAGLVRYTPGRLAWLLECLKSLIDALDGDVAARSEVQLKQRGRSLAQAHASSLLGELSLSLLDASVGNEALARELADARDLVAPRDDVPGLLKALAGVLERWLGRGDAGLTALLAGFGLNAADVRAARDAAETLLRERSVAQGAGNAKVDGDAANVAEGRVIYEMRLLRKVFHRAHERSGDPEIPRLSVSPGLHRVFRSADASDEPTPPLPPPSPDQG